MELWTNKYQPKCLNDIVGNQNKIKQIREWLENFDQLESKKILLISGPPGIGKTTIANLALKEYGYNIIEFNASTIRGPKNINNIFEKVLGFKTVTSMYDKNVKATGIIMDEIDTLCSGGDKGGMSEFLSIIKKRKDKNIYNISNPIICTYNEFSDKKLTELKNVSLEIKMNKPSKMDMLYIINKIEKMEKMDIEESAKALIINHAMDDIRRLINILYDIYITYNNEKIDLSIVEDVIEVFMKKNMDVQIFDMTNQILNVKLEDNILSEYYESDRLLLPMMLHENYINSINNRNISEEEKFNKIMECSEQLIENDIYQTFIYDNQSWELFDIMSYSLGKKFNEISRLRKNFGQVDKLNYTILLNKISYFHTNKKMVNTINNKLGGILLSSENMYYLSEIIVYYLLGKNKNYVKLKEIMDKYKLTVECIDTILRMNKLNNVDIKKKYTNKVKKELEKALS